MKKLKKALHYLRRRLKGVSVSTPLVGVGLEFKSTDVDDEKVKNIERVLEEPALEAQIPGALMRYYAATRDFKLYSVKNLTYPIFTKSNWLAQPSAIRHESGLEIKLSLTGRSSPFRFPAWAKEYEAAIRNCDRQFDDNPAFCAKRIIQDSQSRTISIEVQLAKYSDYVFSAQILDPELRLALSEGISCTHSNDLPYRKTLTVGNLDPHMTKIGLNVMTVQQTSNGPIFYLMDRSTMLFRRPLEYPNAIHVAPAGTVQPEGREYHDNSELELISTLVREWSEEFFQNRPEPIRRLRDQIASRQAMFTVTALGLDALSLKLEICGLLEVPSGTLPLTPIECSEGTIRPFRPHELLAHASQVDRILPAGALAIWHGLNFLGAKQHY